MFPNMLCAQFGELRAQSFHDILVRKCFMATFDTSVVFFNEHGKSTRSAILRCAILLQRWNKLQTAVKNEKEGERT